MKKLFVTTACALAVAGVAFAQGNVNWTGPSFSFMTAQTNTTTYSWVTGGGSSGGGAVGVTTGAASAPSGYYYALLFTSFSGSQTAQPTSLAALNAWQNTGLMATNGAGAGRLADIAPNAGAQVSWSPGVTNSIMLVGWSANLGTTWAAALNVLNNWGTLGSGIVGNAFFGTSATGYITPTDTATSPGASVFGSAATANGLPIFSLNTQLYQLQPVPEPGTIALACLGGASLLLFRRRK